MAIFKGFKPQGMQKIANKMGYQGGMENFDNYLQQNPDKKREMIVYEDAAKRMARGGVVRMQEGGTPSLEEYTTHGFGDHVQLPIVTPGFPSDGSQGNQGNTYVDGVLVPNEGDQSLAGGQVQPRQLSQSYVPQQGSLAGKTIGDVSAERLDAPALPEGATVTPVGTEITEDQLIDPRTTGQVEGDITIDPAQADTETAKTMTALDPSLTDPEKSREDVDSALDTLDAAQTDENDPRAQILAAQQTDSAVGDLEAAQGKALKMKNPVQREIEDGELLEPKINAKKAAKYAEKITAAEATPSAKATVSGQLEERMADFEGGQTPAWAAGAMRNVSARMAARGMLSSSMAGQAMIQAAMESALPIAQADAKIFAEFEGQNLTNRQERRILAAKQRAEFLGMEFDEDFQSRVKNAAKIGDIANQNFTAEQDIALENSKAANTMNLENLNNRQALVIAHASALSGLDLSNLGNRQQASVKNADNFLQMDMANLTNEQQTELFKVAETIQSIFNDQAAENASEQFNATSENQTDQFFSNMESQTDQFNAAQTNAQSQFNAGQENVVERFNAEVNNQRDQFNAGNELVIAQANATWRKNVATADTAAVNRANELNATAVLDISNQAYANVWQQFADTMEFAWTSAENELNRMNALAEAQIDADSVAKAAAIQSASGAGQALGGLLGTIGSALVQFGTGNIF
tara:strand:+ start:515 stop:2599 length:2085 start_codon:yes stop_codon:yes gene_type:complete